jgi:hypothetical protein
MLSDRNGSFIVRLVFRFLAGHLELKDQSSRPSTSHPSSASYPSNYSQQQHQQQEVVESNIVQVPYSFKTTLDYIVQSIDTTIDTNRLADLSFHPNAGPSLKVLIGALGERQETAKLVRKVLKMDVAPEEDPYFQHLLRVQKKKLEDEERRQQEYDEGAGELETSSDKKKKRKQKGKKGSESMYSTSGGSTGTRSGAGGPNEEVPDPVSPFNAQVEALVLDNVGSVVLEQIIKVSNQELFGEIMALPSIQDRLSELSQHPTANFIVQRMIERATTGEGQEEGEEKKNTFLLIVNGLLPHLSLFADRPGVILKLVEACSNDLSLQQLVFDAIFKTVTCSASAVSGSSEKLPFVHALLMLQGKVTSYKKVDSILNPSLL